MLVFQTRRKCARSARIFPGIRYLWATSSQNVRDRRRRNFSGCSPCSGWRYVLSGERRCQRASLRPYAFRFPFLMEPVWDRVEIRPRVVHHFKVRYSCRCTRNTFSSGASCGLGRSKVVHHQRSRGALQSGTSPAQQRRAPTPPEQQSDGPHMADLPRGGRPSMVDRPGYTSSRMST